MGSPFLLQILDSNAAPSYLNCLEVRHGARLDIMPYSLRRKITEMPALKVEYKNAALRVELETGGSAGLFINNIQRMHSSLGTLQRTLQGTLQRTLQRTLRLSSSVQTDYEWHEFIEATITFNEKEISVSLCASNVEIAFETYPAQKDDDKYLNL